MAYPNYNLAVAKQPLEIDIAGAVSGDWSTYQQFCDGLLSTDTVVQAQILAKVSRTTADNDASNAVCTISTLSSSNGLLTRISETRAQMDFVFKPNFTGLFLLPRLYTLRLWVTHEGSVEPEWQSIQVGMYVPNQVIGTTEGDIIDVSTPASVRVVTATGASSFYYAEPFTVIGEALDADGYVIPGVAFTYASSDETVATVDDEGVVSGVMAGTVVISATGRGVSGPSPTLTLFSTVAQLTEGGDFMLTQSGDYQYTE